MSNMSKLTLVPLKRRAPITPEEQRREKLVAKLEEQHAMASAAAEGRTHAVIKQVWQKMADGNRVRVEREKRLKPWWWKDGDGLTLVIRYGAKPVELAKGGKRAISVPDMGALLKAIATVRAAAQDGELDDAITAVVNASKAKQGKA